jgi:hypothetical protein
MLPTPALVPASYGIAFANLRLGAEQIAEEADAFPAINQRNGDANLRRH